MSELWKLDYKNYNLMLEAYWKFIYNSTVGSAVSNLIFKKNNYHKTHQIPVMFYHANQFKAKQL